MLLFAVSEVSYSYGFVREKSMKISLSGKKGSHAFFSFGSYLWKLLKQKPGAVLLVLSCGLRETSSSR